MQARLTANLEWKNVETTENLHLTIITPNGHKLLICPFVDTTVSGFIPMIAKCEELKLPVSKLQDIYPFLKLHSLHGSGEFVYYLCFVKEQLIKLFVENGILDQTSMLNICCILNIRLINHVLEYDRTCEQTKAFQSLGAVCERIGGMKELLDFTQGVVSMVQKSNE